jgi:hypothetical protein
LPAAQLLQSLALVFASEPKYLPAAQSVQTEAPAAEYLPAMQLPQSFELVLASEPEYAGTRFEEQRQLHLPQKHKATVTDSTLRVEMNALEEQADNAKARELYWKPLQLTQVQPRRMIGW